MNRAAIFDLDGTLLVGTSAERLLVPFLARGGLVGPRQAWAFLSGALALPFTGPTRALRGNKRYLRGVDTEALEGLLPHFMATAVEPRLRGGLVARLEELRAQGFLPLLLTGAPDFMARAVVSYLGLVDGVGTPLQRSRGRYTGRLAGTHYFGRGKLVGLEALAMRYDLDLSRSFGFADHPSDAAFLNAVGHPVRVG